MSRKDSTPKKRVNFSITEKTYNLLKEQALRENTTMSHLITNWIWNEEVISGQFLIDRKWVRDLDVATLERLMQYSYENHTTPAQAIRDWIWTRKVKNEVIRGQMSLADLKE